MKKENVYVTDKRNEEREKEKSGEIEKSGVNYCKRIF